MNTIPAYAQAPLETLSAEIGAVIDDVHTPTAPPGTDPVAAYMAAHDAAVRRLHAASAAFVSALINARDRAARDAEQARYRDSVAESMAREKARSDAYAAAEAEAAALNRRASAIMANAG